MRLASFTLRLPILALLVALLATDQKAATQEPPAPRADEPPGLGENDGFEVLARGPVHEAFAQPGTQRPTPSAIVKTQPPPAIEEAPPDQRPEGNNVQWITGYWAWDDEGSTHVWVSGFWRDIPPGRQWVPGYWARLADGWQYVAGYWGETGRGDNQYLPTPPDTVENGPSIEAPGVDHTYVPGLWVYRDTRYLWRPGYWLRCYPDYVWCPAHYCWTPSGYLYVAGYWDYPLHCRGLLFAPVCFHRPLWNTVGWFWQPRYCVYPSVFLGGLFVNSHCNRYYFGDYYGAGYGRQGFTPWLNHRIGPYAYDHNYSHYRWQNRNNPRWEQNLQEVYAGRNSGQLAAPARTLTQQDRLLRNRDRDRDPLRGENLTVLTPLAKLDKNVAALQPVSAAQVKEEKQAGQELRGLGRQREQVESQLAAKGTPQKNDAPRTAKLDLPKAPVPLKETTAITTKAEPKGKGPDNSAAARLGSSSGLPKAPEGKPNIDTRAAPAPVVTKQPDIKMPETKSTKQPVGIKAPTPPPPLTTKAPEMKAPTPPPLTTKAPEMKAPTPPPLTTKAPEIKAPAPSPAPAPVIRSTAPPTPAPAPVIRSAPPPPAPAPRPAPAPAPVIRSTPSPAPAPPRASSPPPARSTPAPAPSPPPGKKGKK